MEVHVSQRLHDTTALTLALMCCPQLTRFVISQSSLRRNSFVLNAMAAIQPSLEERSLPRMLDLNRVEGRIAFHSWTAFQTCAHAVSLFHGKLTAFALFISVHDHYSDHVLLAAVTLILRSNPGIVDFELSDNGHPQSAHRQPVHLDPASAVAQNTAFLFLRSWRVVSGEGSAAVAD